MSREEDGLPLSLLIFSLGASLFQVILSMFFEFLLDLESLKLPSPLGASCPTNAKQKIPVGFI